MAEKESNNPADPWSINYFDPPRPHRAPPTPTSIRPPDLAKLPQVDRLFAAQDDLVRAVNALAEVEAAFKGKEPHGYRTLRLNIQNAYKVLNRYLKEFASPGGGLA